MRLKQSGEQSVRRNWNRDEAACATDQKHRTQGVGKNFESPIHMHASFGCRIITLASSFAGVKRFPLLPRCLAVPVPPAVLSVSRSELCSTFASAGSLYEFFT